MIIFISKMRVELRGPVIMYSFCFYIRAIPHSKRLNINVRHENICSGEEHFSLQDTF